MIEHNYNYETKCEWCGRVFLVSHNCVGGISPAFVDYSVKQDNTEVEKIVSDPYSFLEELKS